MKIKMLTTENDIQLILNHECDYEKQILEVFSKLPNTYWGDFGQCQGGYYRNFHIGSTIYGEDESKDLIIVFPKEKEIEPKKISKPK